ncbi:MAG TPA: sensor domain-containing diguanylate cyclase, partial [Chloroflexota bacterium]
MRQERGGRGTWFDALTRRFTLTIDEDESRELERCAEAEARNYLVVRTRWVLLLLIALYGICAGGFFSFSRYGFFLSRLQTGILIVSLVAVVSYNMVYERFYHAIGRIAFINHVQIFLDILFVSILILFSGGATSWFWPVYLIVTIEATYLLERRQDIWLVVLSSLALFAVLLAGHYYNVLPTVVMPFVDPLLHHDPLFLVLMWCWVAILNVTVAMIGLFLVSVIRQDNEALRRSEEHLINFLDSANDFIFSIAPDGRFLYLNRTSQRELGYGPDDVPALTIDDVFDGDGKAECLREFHQAMAGERTNPVEIVVNARDGKKLTVEGAISCSFKEGAPAAIWVICRDVTERKESQAQLYHMAHHDILTGLPNRFLLIDRLTQAMALAQRLKQHIAVLFFDLDRFKIINDTLGHPVGDKLLQEAARRISGCVRQVDTVARIGGDEFTVVLGNLSDPTDAERVVVKIQHAFAQPFLIDEHELFVTASIGISIYPGDGDDPASLIKKADIA